MQMIIPKNLEKAHQSILHRTTKWTNWQKGFNPWFPQNHSMTRDFVSLSRSTVYWWRGPCSHPGGCWAPPQLPWLPWLLPGSATFHTVLQRRTEHMNGTSQQGEFKYRIYPWDLQLRCFRQCINKVIHSFHHSSTIWSKLVLLGTFSAAQAYSVWHFLGIEFKCKDWFWFNLQGTQEKGKTSNLC